MALSNQLRSIIQWENPEENQLFYRFSDRGEEIKNASKLIVQPGQGCVLVYEGKIKSVFTEEGMYKLSTDNTPFVTTLKKMMTSFESEHKLSLWFFRTAEIVNIRWGTRMPITYNDPFYSFPVKLRAYGNYSIKITEAEDFFRNIVASKPYYDTEDLQELFLSRITQPISNYLANAKFSYADIDSHIVEIARNAQQESESVFTQLGFKLTDFRIEGNSFDKETNERIAEVSDMQAEVKSAQIAGVGYAELQQLKAMRDMAKNEGTAGASMGMFAGMEMGKSMGTAAQPASQPEPAAAPQDDIKSKLMKAKELFDMGLIDENEYQEKKKDILKDF